MTSPRSDLSLPWRLHLRLSEDTGSDIQENSEQTRIYHDTRYGLRKEQVASRPPCTPGNVTRRSLRLTLGPPRSRTYRGTFGSTDPAFRFRNDTEATQSENDGQVRHQ
ncbi:hypothetical protein Acsp04_36190 [Actinomadura sp. NBRC 104425]|nr:hypothetical protein Acsp04_36190 [Actinomadura sp. NBRC 104425]